MNSQTSFVKQFNSAHTVIRWTPMLYSMVVLNANGQHHVLCQYIRCTNRITKHIC